MKLERYFDKKIYISSVQNRIKSWYNEVNYLPPDVITAYRSSVDENSE